MAQILTVAIMIKTSREVRCQYDPSAEKRIDVDACEPVNRRIAGRHAANHRLEQPKSLSTTILNAELCGVLVVVDIKIPAAEGEKGWIIRSDRLRHQTNQTRCKYGKRKQQILPTVSQTNKHVFGLPLLVDARSIIGDQRTKAITTAELR